MRSLVEKICLILSPRCEQVRMLSSESLDRRLTWTESAAVRIHQCLCWSCRQFKRQMAFIRKITEQYARNELDGVSEAKLSDEFKQRLKNLNG
mgnify:CR=1 FL=1